MAKQPKSKSGEQAAGEPEARPVEYEVTLSKAVKIGGSWLRPGASRIRVNAATLEKIRADGALKTEQLAPPPPAAGEVR